MSGSICPEFTQLLLEWSSGKREALDQLLPLVHEELCRLAHAYMRKERADHLLQTSALVNEAYLRLVDEQQVNWENRNHFYGICARLMRQILVDYARWENAKKRGAGEKPASLDDPVMANARWDQDFLAVDEALKDLEKMDPRKAKIVELRYFAGLSVEETAAVVGVSEATIMREWEKAKAWLYRALNSPSDPEDSSIGQPPRPDGGI